MAEPRAPEITIVSRSLPLNLPEFPLLVEHFDLPQPNILSPLPDLCAPGAQGTPRRLEAIIEPVSGVTSEAVRWSLTPLAIPDRILDTRIASFNSAPGLTRLYSSRQADDLFVSLTPHLQFDQELVFPFTADDLLVWLELQLQFASDLTFPVPQTEFSGEQLAFLLALADAYKMAFIRSFLSRQREPQPVTITIEGILEAQDAALEIQDRRWLLTALRELLGLMIHIGGRTEVNLPLVTGALAQREIDRYVEQELLRSVDGGRYELDLSLAQVVGDFFTWLTLISLHDLQIVGGSATAPEACEELLIFVSTTSTVWALASEGLTDCEDDLAQVRFGLRSLDLLDALDVAAVFFEPLPDVTIPEDFYAPVPRVEHAAPAACPTCSAEVTLRRRFCTQCGASLAGPPGERGEWR